ncbi:MAG TPA: UDP-glucose/GDP-mannose dehydrogenase family protein [Planctomycetota bacterium]|nr:UDP-glucose 6-dehydrogenase [Planctomycetota bacterium]MDP7246792.1 UDP-glucose/GDP-mannose dehydrogenase family protein [Planctomycetota bacterium]HJM38561.1 UDP-glucose/GDP-mannose dehydrogenase family protein [Planctomycetota bacterium]
MHITVVGTGYVGLVAGTCFAEMGNHVTCIDIDAEKIENLKNGVIPIFEPGLSEMVIHNHKDGRLNFSTDLKTAVENSRVAFIAVGTPPAEDGSADLSAVLAVAKAIGQAANGPQIIVDKSTVPVGTAAKVKATAQAETEHPIEVVSNPEFLKEGAAIDDFMKPDRVVIGAETEEAFEIMDELYGPFVRSGKPIIHMDPVSAELTKYAANAMLATRISFMNEISRICDLVGADADMIRKGIGTDSRIGSPFLYPGIGYGGSCFPKDVKAIMATARQNGYVFRILESVEEVNESQKRLMVEKIVSEFGEDLSGKIFGLWGLSFKPNTDDMREAAAISVVRGLTERGAKVKAYDPEAHETARAILGDSIEYCNNPYDAIDGADALILATEWTEFRRPDFDRMGELLKQKLIFDGRNIYSASTMRKYGYTRHGVGIPPVKA